MCDEPADELAVSVDATRHASSSSSAIMARSSTMLDVSEATLISGKDARGLLPWHGLPMDSIDETPAENRGSGECSSEHGNDCDLPNLIAGTAKLFCLSGRCMLMES